MYEFDVCSEKLIAKRHCGYRKSTLLLEILDVILANSRWERLDEVRQVANNRLSRLKEGC